jgi:hypothetical protein
MVVSLSVVNVLEGFIKGRECLTSVGASELMVLFSDSKNPPLRWAPKWYTDRILVVVCEGNNVPDTVAVSDKYVGGLVVVKIDTEV